MELIDIILGNINAQPIWIGIAILGLCALIEYVFPPFPGDTVTIAGAVLIPTAGDPWWGVFGAVMLGSVVGAAANWALGDWIARTPQRSSPFHRLVAWEKFAPTIDKIKAKFKAHDVRYIAINRFVPAFRSLIFVAAGLAGLGWRPVVIWAAISATAWNVALMTIGYVVGYNLEMLVDIVQAYTTVFIGLIVLVVIGRFVRSKIRKSA